MDPEQAFERIEESRAALLKSIEGLPEAALTGPQVEGSWTIKDLIAHITSWEAVCVDPLRRFAAGGAFEAEVIEDHLAWNDMQAARWRDQSVADLIKELVRTRLELLAIADSLTEEQWEQSVTHPWGDQGTVSDMLSGLAWHENEHLKSIQNWLALLS